MATEVTKIIDPDGGTGHDYDSLFDWEAAQQGDLTGARDEIAVACCRCTGGTADTTAVTIDGWTTSATQYIKIWTDPAETYRHDGKWNAAKYRVVASVGNGAPIRLSTANVKVIGIQSHQTQVWGSSVAFLFGATDLTLESCVGKSVVSYVYSCSEYARCSVINCISMGGSHGFGYRTGVTLYNCTATGSGVGFSNGYSPATAYNCLEYNNTTGFGIEGTPSGTLYNCASEDSTADNQGGSGNRVDQIFTFVDGANGNFHLASNDAGAIGYGLSNPGSGLFSNDIDGQTRSGSWDIGADQYVSAAVQQFLFNQRRPIKAALRR
jgi:hypothetical protein